jgi:phage-related minor tail protein
LSDQNDSMKGRSPQERGAGDMIEQQSQQSASGSDGGAAALDEARLRQQAIGVRLRQMFDEVVNEPVPDDFLDILRRADKSAEQD